MSNEPRSLRIEHGLPTVLLGLGIILIAVSFISFSFVSKRGWTLEDSRAFAKVTDELHELTVESTERPGRSMEERARHRDFLERKFEQLNNKLERAQQQPERWRRILLWSGAALTAAGALVHLARQRE